MSNVLTVQTFGFKEMQQRLTSLSDDLKGRVAMAAAGSGAGVVRKRAKQNAQAIGLIDTGALVENIAIAREKSNGLQFAYRIGVRGRRAKKAGGNPWYWWMHEFGTSRMPARPFLTPALVSERDAALTAMKRVLGRRLTRLGV